MAPTNSTAVGTAASVLPASLTSSRPTGASSGNKNDDDISDTATTTAPTTMTAKAGDEQQPGAPKTIG